MAFILPAPVPLPPPPLPTFKLIPSLPVEMQNLIWGQAIAPEVPRTIEVLIRFTAPFYIRPLRDRGAVVAVLNNPEGSY